MVHLLNKIFEETIRPEVRFLLLLSMLLCLENIFNVIFKMFKQYKSGKANISSLLHASKVTIINIS